MDSIDKHIKVISEMIRELGDGVGEVTIKTEHYHIEIKINGDEKEITFKKKPVKR